MQLGGAAPKHCGRIEINAYMVTRQLRSRPRGKFERITKFVTCVFWKWYGSACFVVAVELLDGPLPSVSFIRHKTLQHREYCRFRCPYRRVFDQTGKRRYSIEAYFLRQVPADLAIRIQTRFQAAEQLEDKPFTKEYRRIALLRRAPLHLQWRLRRSQYPLKSLAAYT